MRHPAPFRTWADSEGLFRVGEDFLMVENGAQMAEAMKRVRDDPDLRQSLVRNGLETVRARHTCGHRADELLGILAKLKAPHSGSPPAGALKEVA